ncbi:unnamed protein product [Penicillium olsonii]|nr:unnamed protein product [Penicillium olsonii]
MTSLPDVQLSALNWMGLLPLLSALGVGCLLLYFMYPSSPVFPLFNAHERFDFMATKAKYKFVEDAKGLMKGGLAKCDIFRLTCDTGIRLVLSQRYLDEIRDHPSLSLFDLIRSESHPHIKGLEPFGQNIDILLDLIRKKLTVAQGMYENAIGSKVHTELQQESLLVLYTRELLLPFKMDWHELALYPSIQRLVARLSCIVFMGEKMCRDEEWLRVVTNYAAHSLQANDALQLWPSMTRPIVAKFMGSIRILRKEVQAARNIVDRVIKTREIDKENALKNGVAPEIRNDAIQWIQDVAAGRDYEPALMQLGLALVAIFTTADLLTQALLDICGKEELISELREEVLAVLRENEVKKTTMHKLRLMDSVLKESQRLKPISLSTFRRMAMDNIRLADGTQIAKGTGLMIPNEWMWDSQVYENPETFDPYRFVKLREVAGHELSSSLISVSPEHMGFGLGRHACPGRFFAVNQVKIVLCHVLMKYEFKLADGTIPQVQKHGIRLQSDVSAKVLVRRRQETVSLPDLACESE